MENKELILSEKNVRIFIVKKYDLLFVFQLLTVGDNLCSTRDTELLIDSKNIKITGLVRGMFGVLSQNIKIPICNVIKAETKLGSLFYWIHIEYDTEDKDINILKIRIPFDNETNYEIGEENYFKYIDAFKQAGINVHENNINHKKVKRKYLLVSKVLTMFMLLSFICLAVIAFYPNKENFGSFMSYTMSAFFILIFIIILILNEIAAL